MVEDILPPTPLESGEKHSIEPISESENEDRIDVELDRIRERRENSGQSFLINTILPQTFVDYTLVFGVMAGLIFFGMIAIASSGLILGDSIKIDETLSGTPLDPHDCIDKRGEIWIDTWVQEDDLRIVSHNVPPSSSSAMLVAVWNDSAIGSEGEIEGDAERTLVVGGVGDLNLELGIKVILMSSYSVGGVCPVSTR